MKGTLIILFILITCFCNAQTKFDKVIVYLNTSISTGGLVVNNNNKCKNDLKNNADFVITIRDKNEINDFVDLFLQNEYIKSNNQSIFDCTILVDFKMEEELC